MGFCQVPSAVVEKAAVHDMIYAACPKCFASLKSPVDSAALVCGVCGTAAGKDAFAWKYRLKIQVGFGQEIKDAMLFDEVAQPLMGVPAATMRKLQAQHPQLPWLLEQLLSGLRITFRYQSAEARGTRSANAKSQQYQKDIKIISIAPLAKALMPHPLVHLAMEMIAQESSKTAIEGSEHLDSSHPVDS